jgi:exonuclease SbcC
VEKQNQDRQLLELFKEMPVEEGAVDLDIAPDNEIAPPASSAITSTNAPAMRLDSLSITNLWSYDHSHITFDSGITVIAGMNGSGKSSILESIFFALYGSEAGPAMDRALVDVLRIGSDTGGVALKFSHGNHSYTSQMAIRRRGDSVISEKESCRLVRDDGESWVGVKVVTHAIEEMFGMNRDDFTNCVYVRQGEIDRLIRASGDERRQMIDRLLRLEKLDKYANRAKDGARRAVNRHLDVLSARAMEIKKDSDKLHSEEPAKRLGELEEQLKIKQNEQRVLEDQLAQAEVMRQGHVQKLKQVEEVAKAIQEKTAEIAKKEEQFKQQDIKRAAIEAERARLIKQFSQHRDRLITALEQLKLPQEPLIDSINVATTWEEIELLQTERERDQSHIEKARAQLSELQLEQNKAAESLTKERDPLLKSLTQNRTLRESLTKELEGIQALIEEGKCPVCKQPVEEHEFGQHVDESEKTLAKQLGEIQKAESSLKELEAKIESLKSQGAKSLQDLQSEIRNLEARRVLLDEAKDLTKAMLQVKEQGLDKKESLQVITDVIENLRTEIAQLKSKLEEQKSTTKDVDELEAESKKIEKILDQLNIKKGILQKEIEEFLNQRGVLQSRIEQLAQFTKQSEETAQELDKIKLVTEELGQLTEFYGSLKKELRMQNIGALEHYFNEFFHVMDSGSSYSRVLVNEEYEIFVQLKDGSFIKPELLSGGERALINIALRSAIHQVLSQATCRMPLILDEPTIYLDRERINRLEFLLEELGDKVGQVIVVSHEAGLVEGAHHEYRTEKRADNTSQVTRVR